MPLTSEAPRAAYAVATTLMHEADHWQGNFSAMGGPCEILVDRATHRQAVDLLNIASAEAKRIEVKFSRYRDDSIVARINSSHGQAVEVDDETARLLDYAAECWTVSDGLFDITSGVLRRAWKFDGSDRLPSQEAVDKLLPLIGWEKVTWKKPYISLPVGMEIDLGGIGKEYAVDTTAVLLQASVSNSFVVNYGGDLFVSGSRADGRGWIIGVDDPGRTGERSVGEMSVARGGVATSGDARRYLLRDGIRYGHILNPRSGWPVVGAPRSVTVVADTCVEAGIFSTMAMLHGPDAEQFLKDQGVRHWIHR